MDTEWYKQKELTKGEAILQVKMMSNSPALHIQGYAETEYNRPYGFAINLSLPHGVTIDYSKHTNLTVESLATNSKDYLRGHMTVYKYIDGHQLSLEIIDDNGNYDLSSTKIWRFDLNEKDFGSAQLVDFATKEGLVTFMDGNRFVMEDEEE